MPSSQLMLPNWTPDLALYKRTNIIKKVTEKGSNLILQITIPWRLYTVALHVYFRREHTVSAITIKSCSNSEMMQIGCKPVWSGTLLSPSCMLAVTWCTLTAWKSVRLVEVGLARWVIQRWTKYRGRYWSVWPASWSSGQGLWLLIMRSRVRFPVLPWEFFLAGKDTRGDHGLGS